MNKNLRTQLLEFFNGRGFKVSMNLDKMHESIQPHLHIYCRTFTKPDFEDQTDWLDSDECEKLLSKNMWASQPDEIIEVKEELKEAIRKNYKPERTE